MIKSALPWAQREARRVSPAVIVLLIDEYPKQRFHFLRACGIFDRVSSVHFLFQVLRLRPSELEQAL